MVRVTCLSPMKKVLLLLFSFCSLGTLDLQLRTAILLLGAINEQPYKANKKIH